MKERRARPETLQESLQMFQDAGFETSQPCDILPSSFELAARRDEEMVLLKFLQNADELEAAVCAEVRRISHHLRGSPLVVADRAGREALKRGVVYRRHGVSSVSPETLAEYLLEETLPLAFAAPGGLYVEIAGAALRKARVEKGLSLGDVAARLGTSRRTVQKYEQEGMAATVEKALRLRDLFGVRVLRRQSLTPREGAPEPPEETLSDQRLLRLRLLGFRVHPAAHAPFDAVLLAEGGEAAETGPEEGEPPSSTRTLLVGLGRPTPRTYRRARITGSISAVAKAESAFFVEGEREPPEEEAGGTILLPEEALRRARDAKDLLVKIEELRG